MNDLQKTFQEYFYKTVSPAQMTLSQYVHGQLTGLALAYNPDQPRDERGRFGAGGGAPAGKGSGGAKGGSASTPASTPASPTGATSVSTAADSAGRTVQVAHDSNSGDSWAYDPADKAADAKLGSPMSSEEVEAAYDSDAGTVKVSREQIRKSLTIAEDPSDYDSAEIDTIVKDLSGRQASIVDDSGDGYYMVDFGEGTELEATVGTMFKGK